MQPQEVPPTDPITQTQPAATPSPEPIATIAPAEPAPQAPVSPQDDPLKHILPIGRSALAVTAGYVALFAVLVIPAPIALLLGILALHDINKHPEKLGKGRAWLAIILGGLFSLLLGYLIISALI